MLRNQISQIVIFKFLRGRLNLANVYLAEFKIKFPIE